MSFMSLLSFSSYECSDEEYYKRILPESYGKFIETVPPGYCYRAMAQPLIYYAQVQPSDTNDSRGQQRRKVNQSCFVKAFKWYTQDRPPENKSMRSAELRDFASWLDAKYSEYLHETETSQPDNCLEACKTLAYEAMRKEFCRTNEACTAEKFARVKCLWKKHKSKGKSDGDEPNKTSKTSNVSCKFILQPKDMTRTASECCHTNLPNTIDTTESQTMNKSIRKSHSMISVCHEKTTKDFIDMMIQGPHSKEFAKKVVHRPEKRTHVSKTTQHKPLIGEKLSITKQKNETKIQQKCEQEKCTFSPKTVGAIKHKDVGTGSNILRTTSKSRNINHESRNGPHVTSTLTGINTFLCRCPEKPCKTSNKSDSPTKPKQSSYVPIAPLKKCCMTCKCPENITKVDASSQYYPNNIESSDDFTNKTLKLENTKSECDVNLNEIELHSVEKAARSLPIFKNTDVQTSDHSINIVTGHEFPLFMKVICADNLAGTRDRY